MTMQRRDFLKAMGVAGLAAGPLAGCAVSPSRSGPKVVVVGAGYGGATVAKYLDLWSNGTLDITLVEADPAFVSCPMSNLVLGGSKQISDLTVGYGGLAKRGISVRLDIAQAVDPLRQTVRISNQVDLPYDRLVLSPGVDFLFDQVPGLGPARASEDTARMEGGAADRGACAGNSRRCATAACSRSRSRRAPYRCPPGPYERACQVAWYFKRAKPKSKVLILDGNEDVVSKKGLFMKAWSEDYKGLVEYRPNYVLTGVDAQLDDGEVRDGGGRQGRRAERDPAAARGRDRGASGRHHGEQPLVRGRLPLVRVDQGPEDPRGRRRDPDRAGDAEVRAHGEPAREGRGSGDPRRASRAGRRTPRP